VAEQRVTTDEERVLRQRWTEIKLWSYVGRVVARTLNVREKKFVLYTFINFDQSPVNEI